MADTRRYEAISPRTRGADLAGEHAVYVAGDQPAHAWSGRWPARPGRSRNRPVPARVGRTAPGDTRSTPTATSPRACGPDSHRCPCGWPCRDQSPRVWAGHLPELFQLTVTGPVPARVGRTLPAADPLDDGPVPARVGRTRPHGGRADRRPTSPRACGPDCLTYRPSRSNRDQSPRVWAGPFATCGATPRPTQKLDPTRMWTASGSLRWGDTRRCLPASQPRRPPRRRGEHVRGSTGV